MSLCYDLHSHSTASDGTLSPTQLVAKAYRSGVDVLALTDHDSTAGLAEAKLEADKAGVRLVSGVEISATWRRQTIHIVGLNIDPENQVLQQGLNGLREFRDWRAEEIARRLEKSGVEGAYKGAMGYSKGAIISRTHFAHFLVAHGYANSIRDVFKHYLVRNKPGYVSGQWAALEDVRGWVTQAGGQAVIAHPARYNLSATKMRNLIGEFQECGGDGFEVVSGSHNRNDCYSMAGHAQRFGLHASCGSDYHGPENTWVRLGKLMEFPPGCMPIWQSDSWCSQAVEVNEIISSVNGVAS
jgi:predicted metal-dependent phosphoesterase TrpH